MNSASQWAVGLMTGTVLDGNIDVALLKTDGQTIESMRSLHSGPDTRTQLLNCCINVSTRRCNGNLTDRSLPYSGKQKID